MNILSTNFPDFPRAWFGRSRRMSPVWHDEDGLDRKTLVIGIPFVGGIVIPEKITKESHPLNADLESQMYRAFHSREVVKPSADVEQYVRALLSDVFLTELRNFKAPAIHAINYEGSGGLELVWKSDKLVVHLEVRNSGVIGIYYKDRFTERAMVHLTELHDVSLLIEDLLKQHDVR